MQPSDDCDRLFGGAAFDGAGDPAMPPPDMEPSPNGRDRSRQSSSKWNFTRPSDDADQPPLVYWDDRGMLPKVIGGCSVIVWGRKSSHKSGLLIKECLDAALSQGAKILYLACEGAHGIRTARLPAACRQRGIDIGAIDDLWRTFPIAPGLMNNAEVDELIAACRGEGFEPAIIVIDTLTRAVAGFDINAPATGAGLILGIERLGAAFDATVIAVTHPGKDSDKGAIGSSLIESLAFAIWQVSLDGEAVFVDVQKMKDGPAEFVVPFKVAWVGPQGEPVAAKSGVPVVVEAVPGEQLHRADRPDKPLAPGPSRALQLLADAIAVGGTVPPFSGHIPADTHCVTEEVWRKYCYEGSIADKGQEAKKKAFQRAAQVLLDKGRVGKWGEWVWLTK